MTNDETNVARRGSDLQTYWQVQLRSGCILDIALKSQLHNFYIHCKLASS